MPWPPRSATAPATGAPPEPSREQPEDRGGTSPSAAVRRAARAAPGPPRRLGPGGGLRGNSPKPAAPPAPPPLSGAGPAALGTFEFGTPALPAAMAYELLDAYYEQGGRPIDSARTYGPDGGAG